MSNIVTNLEGAVSEYVVLKNWGNKDILNTNYAQPLHEFHHSINFYNWLTASCQLLGLILSKLLRN